MARKGHRAVQIQETVWITGGGNGGLFGDMWQLDLETMQWSRHRRGLSFPVAHHAMTVTDESKMVMFGGWVEGEEGDTVTYTNSVYTSWLKVPTLKLMAWEALCQHVPHMSSLPVSTLMKEGVPKDCVEMLGCGVDSKEDPATMSRLQTVVNAMYPALLVLGIVLILPAVAFIRFVS